MVAAARKDGSKKEKRSLVKLLGLDGERMRWEALLELMLAAWLAGVFVKLMGALLYGLGLTDAMGWIVLAAHSALQAALLGLCMRWLRRDVRAAALAGVVLGVVWPVIMGLLMVGHVFLSMTMIIPQASAVFCLVVGIALGLRVFKVDLPALIIGGMLGKGLHLILVSLVVRADMLGFVDPYWIEAGGLEAGGMGGAWPQFVAGGVFGLALWGAGKLLPKPGEG